MNRYYSITSKYDHHKSKLYFSRIELNIILEYYAFGVSKGNWKDYAIKFEKNKAHFHFFKNSSEKPIISISKKASTKKNEYNFQLLESDSKFITDKKIDNLFIYLKRKNIKLVNK